MVKSTIKSELFECFSWRLFSYRNRLLGFISFGMLLLLEISPFCVPKDTFSDQQMRNLHLMGSSLLIIMGWILARFINRVNRRAEKMPSWYFYQGIWKTLFVLIQLAFYVPISSGIIWFIINIFFMINM
jgi:hypothetical protein